MRVNTVFCPKGVDLPYRITVDNPLGSIGVFGDSFAQLAEFRQIHNYFDHESSWIYFLANILNMEAHTYGVSKASVGDIFYTLQNCRIDYDVYILFLTHPQRENTFSKLKFNTKNSIKIKNFLKNKKSLVIYWDKKHRIFDFNTLEYISKFHLTNKNIPDEKIFKGKINCHDMVGSHHHMSARGNLLLALELSKLLIA